MKMILKSLWNLSSPYFCINDLFTINKKEYSEQTYLKFHF